MPCCIRTVPGLHRWSHKLLKRFAYVVLAAADGNDEVLGQYSRSIERLQKCLRDRIEGMSPGHHRDDLGILLMHTHQLLGMVSCVPRCLAADLIINSREEPPRQSATTNTIQNNNVIHVGCKRRCPSSS